MEKTLKLEIANRLKGLLEERGLTQAEFARGVGFTTGYINDIIRGRTKPSIHLLRKMRDVYAVSSDWVLSGKTPSTRDVDRPIIVAGQGAVSYYIAVPMVKNLETRVLRGRLIVVKDIHPDYCCIVPRQWVTNPKETFCTIIKDNSMEPTIPRWSYAGVNCGISDPYELDGKLCAVREGSGGFSIRRLRLTRTHLLFEPDNPTSRGKTLCVGVDEKNPIIGKVEWAWSFLK